MLRERNSKVFLIRKKKNPHFGDSLSETHKRTHGTQHMVVLTAKMITQTL